MGSPKDLAFCESPHAIMTAHPAMICQLVRGTNSADFSADFPVVFFLFCHENPSTDKLSRGINYLLSSQK